MDYGPDSVDWNAKAGQRLEELARALPAESRLEITVFGSAPLQLLACRMSRGNREGRAWDVLGGCFDADVRRAGTEQSLAHGGMRQLGPIATTAQMAEVEMPQVLGDDFLRGTSSSVVR